MVFDKIFNFKISNKEKNYKLLKIHLIKVISKEYESDENNG